MIQPWTAAVALGKGFGILVATFIAYKFACGLAEWIRACLLLAKQKVPRPPPFDAIEDLGRSDLHRLGPMHEKQYGGIFWTHLLHLHALIISEPRMITQVLDRQLYPEFIDKPSLYQIINQGTAKPACTSLVSASTGEATWKAVRKGISPAFAQSNVRAASETSIATAYRLAETLAAHGSTEALDVDAAMQNAAFDVIGMFGFGKDFKATLDLEGEGALACKALSEGMLLAVRRLLDLRFWIPFTSKWKKYRSTRERVLTTFKSLMKESLARGAPTPGDQSIVAFLQRVRGEDGKPLPELRFWSESSIMFFAGVETTGHTLGFVLYFISQHPEVEAKIVRELQALGVCATADGKEPCKLTPADMQKLTYLPCVVKETQRLMPVVPLVVRQAQQDVKIGDLLVPKNTVFITHFLAMHTSERYWERPLEFIPERWLDPDCEYTRPIDPLSSYVPTGPADFFGADRLAKGKKGSMGLTVNGDTKIAASCTAESMRTDGSDPYTYKGQRVRRYMPWAAGSRNCVGMPQAQVTMQATLATLLSRFSFRLAERMGSAEDVSKAEVYRITVSLKDGLWMYCTPRHAPQKVPDGADNAISAAR